MRLYRFGPRGG